MNKRNFKRNNIKENKNWKVDSKFDNDFQNCISNLKQKIFIGQKVMSYVEIPVKFSLSNYNDHKDCPDEPLQNENLDHSRSYDDLHPDMPSEFKNISGNVAILHGHTHSLSDIYKSRGTQDAISCVVAIAMKTVYPIKFWTRSTMDTILATADDLCLDLTKQTPSVKKITSADTNNLRLKLNKKNIIVNVDVVTVTGTVRSTTSVMPNLNEALQKFFLTNREGVIETNFLFAAVWKDDDLYYMFQPYGCDSFGNRMVSEMKDSGENEISKEVNVTSVENSLKGKCCLVRSPTIDFLVSLYSNNLDRKNRNDYFIIRSVSLMDDVPGAKNWHYFVPGEVGKSWILRGTINIYDDMLLKETKGVQGIAIPVVALVIAYQVPPAEWTSDIVNEIILNGDNYYDFCTSHLEDKEEVILTVSDLRNKFFVKKRKIHISIEDSIITGNLNSIHHNEKMIRTLSLEDGVMKFFNQYKCIYGIVEIGQYSVAIWRYEEHSQKESNSIFTYYLYDPYANHNIGLGKEEVEEHGACVLRFLNLVDLVQYIKEHFLEKDENQGNITSEYLIHNLNVLSVGNELNDEEMEQEKMAIEKPENRNYIFINDETACLRGNFSQNDELIFDVKTRDRQQSANAFVTLVMAKLYNPTLWHSEIVDDILRIGDKLTTENINNISLDEEEGEEGEFTRQFLLPSEINDEFNIGIFKVTVSLNDELRLGNLNDLEDCLTRFFEDNSMGIIRQNNVSIPVWKQREIYFMMDPRGRDESGNPDTKNGHATVFWTMNLSNLSFLIKSSLKNTNDVFVIDEFTIEDIIQIEAEVTETKEDSQKKEEESWYSFGKAEDGVWMIKNKEDQTDDKYFERSVTISIVCILFSKIYKPEKFDEKIVSKILTEGNQFYENCKCIKEENYPITLNTISKSLHLLNQRFKFEVHDCIEFGKLNGQKLDVLDLQQGLENYFKKHNSGVIILDGTIHLAVFEVDGFFYSLISNTEFVRTNTLQTLSKIIEEKYNHANEFEISWIVIVSYPPDGEVNNIFGSIIGNFSLPPLNAFEPSKNFSQAILRGSIDAKLIPYEIRGKQTAASCVVALTMSVLKYPLTWINKTLDEITIIGLKLYHESSKFQTRKEKVKLKDVVRIFEIGNNVMTADVEPTPFKTGLVRVPPPGADFNEKNLSKRVKDTKVSMKASIKVDKMNEVKSEASSDLRVKTLKQGLDEFFRENNAGVVVVGSFHSAIWKDCNIYFMYRPFGKNIPSKTRKETSCLLWFVCLTFIIQEIENNLTENEIHNKYEIYNVIVQNSIVKPFPHPPGFEYYLKNNASPLLYGAIKKLPTLSISSQSSYFHIDEDLSILMENRHGKCDDTKIRCLSSSGVAAVAISVSKLHSPSSWNKSIIDTILEYGINLHTDSARLLRSKNRNLLPHELLTHFIISNFQVIITVEQMGIPGVLLPNDLMHSLKYFFQKHHSGILHAGHTSYAMIKSDEKYYLFHPNYQNEALGFFQPVSCVFQSSVLSKLITILIDNLKNIQSSVFTIHKADVVDLHFFSNKFY